MGVNAMRWAGNANQCTAIGTEALFNTGSNPFNWAEFNTGNGFQALYSNKAGDNNTAIGRQSLYLNVSGSNNTAAGGAALYSNTRGANNTATGFQALYDNNTASGGAYNNDNTATGHYALFSNKGSENTGFGKEAMYRKGDGDMNTALGYQSLYSNVGSYGAENTAIGYKTLCTNSSGFNNNATGAEALYSNTTGSENTANGYYSLHLNSTGIGNVAMGVNALSNSPSLDHNTTVGNNSLFQSQGVANTACGFGASEFGNAVSTANLNSAIGYKAYNGLGISHTGSLNTVVGANAEVNGNYSNASALGSGAVVGANNRVTLGDAAITLVSGTPTFWTVTSDGRFKTNVSETDVKGLEFIKRLRPVVYNLDTKKLQEHLVKNLNEGAKKEILSKDYTKSTAIRRTGFIAQEVEKAAQESGYNFNAVNIPQNEDDHYSVAYSLFVVPLVKGVQEQQVMLDKQKSIARDLQEQLSSQNDLMKELSKKLAYQTSLSETMTIENSFSMNSQPNPFSSETLIQYNLPEKVNTAILIITNLSGAEIISYSLSSKRGDSFVLSSKGLTPGIYIYSIKADGKILGSKRLIVSSN